MPTAYVGAAVAGDPVSTGVYIPVIASQGGRLLGHVYAHPFALPFREGVGTAAILGIVVKSTYTMEELFT